VAAKWPWPDVRTDSRLPGQKCFYERLHRPPPTRSGRWDTASPTTLPENKWRWRCSSSRRWSGLECPRDSCRSKKVLVFVTAWLSRWKVFLLSGLKLENPFALSILFTIYLQFFFFIIFPRCARRGLHKEHAGSRINIEIGFAQGAFSRLDRSMQITIDSHYFSYLMRPIDEANFPQGEYLRTKEKEVRHISKYYPIKQSISIRNV
jgi:hypothetical protein